VAFFFCHIIFICCGSSIWEFRDSSIMDCSP
jgi:hypothetical protein